MYSLSCIRPRDYWPQNCDPLFLQKQDLVTYLQNGSESISITSAPQKSIPSTVVIHYRQSIFFEDPSLNDL